MGEVAAVEGEDLVNAVLEHDHEAQKVHRAVAVVHVLFPVGQGGELVLGSRAVDAASLSV